LKRIIIFCFCFPKSSSENRSALCKVMQLGKPSCSYLYVSINNHHV
jgi:hypothetical protein